MTVALLLRPAKKSGGTPTPAPESGGHFVGGVDGSNLVPLKPKKKRKKKAKAIQETIEALPEFTEYVVELAEIAPELLTVLMPEALMVEREAERLDFLRNLEEIGLRLLREEAENYLSRLELEQQVAMELELEAIRDRIDDAENEELITLLIHKLH